MGKTVVNCTEVISCQGLFATRGSAVKLLTNRQGSRDKRGVLSCMDIGKVTFQVIADFGEVIVNGFWVNVVTHENCEKTQGFRGEINGPVMEMTERQVGVGTRSVGSFCRVVDHVAKSNGTFVNETLMCPQLPSRLPGQHWIKVHCRQAPSASQGGVKPRMVRLGTRWWARGKLS